MPQMFLTFQPPVLVIRNMKPYFIFWTISLKKLAGGTSYYAKELPYSRPSLIVKIIMKVHLHAFGRTLKIEKF